MRTAKFMCFGLTSVGVWLWLVGSTRRDAGGMMEEGSTFSFICSLLVGLCRAPLALRWAWAGLCPRRINKMYVLT